MIGTTLSHYRIIEKFGAGGMGVVYKAEDTQLKRTIALKFLPEELSKNRPNLERFQPLLQAPQPLLMNRPKLLIDAGHHQNRQLFQLPGVWFLDIGISCALSAGVGAPEVIRTPGLLIREFQHYREFK